MGWFRRNAPVQQVSDILPDEPTYPPNYVPPTSWPVGAHPGLREPLPPMPEQMPYIEGEGAHPDWSAKMVIPQSEMCYINRDREHLLDMLKRVAERLELWSVGTYEEKAFLKEMKNTIRLSQGFGLLPDAKPFHRLGEDPRVLDHLGRPVGGASEPVELFVSTAPVTSQTSGASGRWRDPRSRNDRSVRREIAAAG